MGRGDREYSSRPRGKNWARKSDRESTLFQYLGIIGEQVRGNQCKIQCIA